MHIFIICHRALFVCFLFGWLVGFNCFASFCFSDKPDITISMMNDGDASQCKDLPPDSAECVVTEGQTVHLHCNATSNPAPAEFTWQPGSTNNSTLSILSVNHTQHTATFNCSVATGRCQDGRLPLRKWKSVDLLVQCTCHKLFKLVLFLIRFLQSFPKRFDELVLCLCLISYRCGEFLILSYVNTLSVDRRVHVFKRETVCLY